MAYENAPFKIRQGDDHSVEIVVSESDGSASRLQGIPIRWTYGRSAAGPALVTKTESSPGVSIALGKITIRFNSAETETLTVYTSYRFQCRVSFPDGRETVATGSFAVEPTQT